MKCVDALMNMPVKGVFHVWISLGVTRKKVPVQITCKKSFFTNIQNWVWFVV